MKANYGNYKALEDWLVSHDYEYHIFGDGHQYRILGPVTIVDVWPARMTIHVVKTEAVDPDKYFKLDYDFNGDQLEKILNGEII